MYELMRHRGVTSSSPHCVWVRYMVNVVNQPCCLAASVFFRSEGGLGGTLQAKKWACVQHNKEQHSMGLGGAHTHTAPHPWYLWQQLPVLCAVRLCTTLLQHWGGRVA